MKISANKVKTTPSHMSFGLCVYGELDETLKGWCEHWGMSEYPSGKFTNIIIPEEVKLASLFEDATKFKYMDGFSPNLNKHLHVGHLSNLVLASAFQNMGLVESPIAILGDTVTGDVDHEDALHAFIKICNDFNYEVDHTYLASHMEYDGDLLVNGEGKYEGTKVFDLGENKIVGLKSDGSTTYFYQDMALAEHLDADTLYLTGSEQIGHFEMISEVFPTVHHLPLGLVSISSNKMSSRAGNVIMVQDLIDELMKEFGDMKLVVNVIAGQILKSKPKSAKNIDKKGIFNPKTSAGLYLSYTMARLKSAGMIISPIIDFNGKEIEFAFIKAKSNMMPNTLFEALYELAKKINSLYLTHTISDNEENQKMFQPMLDDLALGMKLLGMHEIDKV